MHLFEYPYVIITFLVAGFILAGGFGLYFATKCVKTADGSDEKSFLGENKLGGFFELLGKQRKVRSLIYICVDTDDMIRLYSESKAGRLIADIRPVLLENFCLDGGGIATYGEGNFIAVNEWDKEKIINTVEKTVAEINKILSVNEVLKVATVSFGIYTTQATEVNFRTAITRAKQACTMSENRKVPYTEWDNIKGKELERKIKRENNIESEIEKNRFFLEYQPIIDAKTGGIVGAEVLSRLNSESEGVLTPGAFLSAVNSVGLNEKFDYYIFEKNCKWISNNKDEREKFVYTINFSRSTLCEVGFAEKITELSEKYNLDFSCLAVEILEDKDLSAQEKSIMTENILKLKDKGFTIFLDDFGSGYTSFSDLSNFDISIVKIDKKIISNAVNQTGFVILKNIINTAKELNFRTLCEGIETEEHKKAAIDAGCDLLQGYYFSRPIPAVKFEEMIKGEKNVIGDNPGI